MHTISEKLLGEIRSRFAQVDECPQQGKRIFFENAGGALTLNSAGETSKQFAAIAEIKAVTISVAINWRRLSNKPKKICVSL